MESRQAVMTTKDWFVTFLISAIPLVGQVALLVWAFGSGSNENKSNFAKAYLLFIVFAIALVVVIGTVFGLALVGAMSGY